MTRLEELESLLTDLIEQDYIDSMSDDLYYTNGRRAAAKRRIAEVEMEIQQIKQDQWASL
jgi:hypothetical protein